jgi:hypothetical protein
MKVLLDRWVMLMLMPLAAATAAAIIEAATDNLNT